MVHDDLPSAGDFACSNPLMNRIYQNIVWGSKEIIAACQPTARNATNARAGWAIVPRNRKGESFIFDTRPFTRNGFRTWPTPRGDSGSVPDVCPSYWPLYIDDVTWPSSTAIIPARLARTVWRHGDRRAALRQREEVGGLHATLRDQRNYFQGQLRRLVRAAGSAKLIHSLDPESLTDKALWPRRISITI